MKIVQYIIFQPHTPNLLRDLVTPYDGVLNLAMDRENRRERTCTERGKTLILFLISVCLSR